MKRWIALGLYSVLALGGCADVTRPVNSSEGAVALPTAPSMDGSAATHFTMTSPIGPGSPFSGQSIQYQGNYEWYVDWSTDYMMSTKTVAWYISRDHINWEYQKTDQFPADGRGSGRSYGYKVLNTTDYGSFWIRAVGSANGWEGPATSTTELYVPVPNPLYAYPSVGINGPAVVNSSGDYTWTATPGGGDGSYAYRWEVEWIDQGVTETNLSNQPSLTLGVVPETGEFIVRVYVTSIGRTVVDSRMVCNFIYPNDFSCT